MVDLLLQGYQQSTDDNKSSPVNISSPITLLAASSLIYGTREIWLTRLVDLAPDAVQAYFLLNKVLLALLILSGCWAVIRLSNRLLFEGALRRQTKSQVPRILPDLYNTFVGTLTFIALMVVVLDQSIILVSVLVGTVVVLTAVFFRDMLDDLVAGLSVNLDPAFSVGDLIQVPGHEPGRLAEITWRSSTLALLSGATLVVPNRTIRDASLTNYSGTANALPVDVSLVMDYSVPVERVVRILEGAVQSAVIQARILEEPKPFAFAKSPGSYGNEYVVRAFFDPGSTTEAQVRSAVVDQIMKHLRSAGLAPSLPKQNLFLGEVRTLNMEWLNPVHRETLMSGFTIFEPLITEELAALARSVVIHEVTRGESVIRQHEEGTSMYGLAEGFLEVSLDADDGNQVKVGEIVPGQFFGEMSMLVGEPRGATVTAVVDSVVFEITRSSFSKTLEQRPEVASIISRVIAERQLTNTQRLEASEADRQDAIERAANSLVNRMKSIFSTVLSR